METGDFETAIAKAGELLRREPPFRHEKYSYSTVAGSAFEKIRRARADGFSFAQICAALEKAGLLPNNANPHSFRQAFHREEVRRKRGKELPRPLSERAEPEKRIAASPASPNGKKPATPPAMTTTESEEAARERVKKMTSRVIDTGTGKIVKYSDGSFSYD